VSTLPVVDDDDRDLFTLPRRGDEYGIRFALARMADAVWTTSAS
jgi:hypothetical protein